MAGNSEQQQQQHMSDVTFAVEFLGRQKTSSTAAAVWTPRRVVDVDAAAAAAAAAADTGTAV